MVKRLLQIIGIVIPIICAAPAQAQVPPVDGTANSSAADPSAITSLTWSHTVTSNANGIIIVGCAVTDATEADRNISTVTYSTVGLSKILQGAVDTIHAEMWRLVAPATGAHDVVVTFGGTVDMAACGSVSLTGVDQSSPVDVSDDFFANNAAPSISLTTTVADTLIIDVVNFNNRTSTFTMDAASGRTERWNFVAEAADPGIRTGGSTRSTTTAGAYTNAWTSSIAASFNYLAAAFKPAASVAYTGKLGGGAKLGGTAKVQ